jgi:hypothetical protein
MIYWSGSLLYVLSGREDLVAAVASNTPFLGVLAISTYAIGRRLGGRLAGLLAAFFLLTTPMLSTQFKEYLTDAPLTAMVALSLYFLIAADGFSNRRASIMLGVAAGLGALTKWTFPLALLLPVLLGVAIAVKRSVEARSYERLANVALATIVFYALAAPWYVRSYDFLRATYHERGPEAALTEGDPAVHSLDSYLWYFWKFLDPQLFILPVLAFVVGLVFLARRRRDLGGYAYLLLNIVGTYVGFTLLLNKDTRFTLPIVPSVAVIATSWMPQLSRRTRTIAVAATVAYGAFTFGIVSFGFAPLPERVAIGSPPFAELCDASNCTRYGDRPVTVIAKRGYIIGPPSGEDWHQEEIFQEIAHSGSRRTLWYRSPDTIWFNHAAMNYYARQYGVEVVDSPKRADYLAIRNSQLDPGPPKGFSVNGLHHLPDGTTLVLYRRRATDGRQR